MLRVDEVVITLVCIPLPHYSVLHPASEKGGRTQKRKDEIEGESVKEEGEGERHG